MTDGIIALGIVTAITAMFLSLVAWIAVGNLTDDGPKRYVRVSQVGNTFTVIGECKESKWSGCNNPEILDRMVAHKAGRVCEGDTRSVTKLGDQRVLVICDGR